MGLYYVIGSKSRYCISMPVSESVNVKLVLALYFIQNSLKFFLGFTVLIRHASTLTTPAAISFLIMLLICSIGKGSSAFLRLGYSVFCIYSHRKQYTSSTVMAINRFMLCSFLLQHRGTCSVLYLRWVPVVTCIFCEDHGNPPVKYPHGDMIP